MEKWGNEVVSGVGVCGDIDALLGVGYYVWRGCRSLGGVHHDHHVVKIDNIGEERRFFGDDPVRVEGYSDREFVFDNVSVPCNGKAAKGMVKYIKILSPAMTINMGILMLDRICIAQE